MRIVHTSDWHIGKQLRGASRLDEHRRVLAEIVEQTAEARADLVLVVGDVFETAAPAPEAQAVAWEALLALRATGAQVVVVAGNHDHAAAFEAVRPVFAQLGIVVAGHVARPDAGGVLDTVIRGERLRLALLPWLARQHVLRAEQLMALEGGEAVQVYAARVQRMIDALCASFAPDSVNIVAAHAYVRGGTRGGGERLAALVDEYFVTPQSFPPTATYVALGHLHRRQPIVAGVPIWYSGSPIQVDFGDDTDPRGMNLIVASPGLPPKVEPMVLSSPARLATIRGPLAALESLAGAARADHLRVVVEEPARPGLGDEVRALVPNAVEVTVVSDVERDPRARPDARDHVHRTPRDLFGEYLDSVGAARDPALLALFDDLHDQAVAP
jgi:exonuclease SbcD